jgi:hypothetical protein
VQRAREANSCQQTTTQSYTDAMNGEKRERANRIATGILFVVILAANIGLSALTDLGIVARGVLSIGSGVLAATIVYATLTRGASTGNELRSASRD